MRKTLLLLVAAVIMLLRVRADAALPLVCRQTHIDIYNATATTIHAQVDGKGTAIQPRKLAAFHMLPGLHHVSVSSRWENPDVGTAIESNTSLVVRARRYDVYRYEECSPAFQGRDSSCGLVQTPTEC
jgi:hypothetical protein